MDWSKHNFGPGTQICCRCLTYKETDRLDHKWCASCATLMASRRPTPGLGRPSAVYGHGKGYGKSTPPKERDV